MKKEYFYNLINKNSIVNSKYLVEILNSNDCKVSVKESHFVDAREGNILFMKDIPSDIKERISSMTKNEIRENLESLYDYTLRSVTLFVDFSSVEEDMVDLLDEYIVLFIETYLTGDEQNRNVVIDELSSKSVPSNYLEVVDLSS